MIISSINLNISLNKSQEKLKNIKKFHLFSAKKDVNYLINVINNKSLSQFEKINILSNKLNDYDFANYSTISKISSDIKVLISIYVDRILSEEEIKSGALRILVAIKSQLNKL